MTDFVSRIIDRARIGQAARRTSGHQISTCVSAEASFAVPVFLVLVGELIEIVGDPDLAGEGAGFRASRCGATESTARAPLRGSRPLDAAAAESLGLAS